MECRTRGFLDVQAGVVAAAVDHADLARQVEPEAAEEVAFGRVQAPELLDEETVLLRQVVEAVEEYGSAFSLRAAICSGDGPCHRQCLCLLMKIDGKGDKMYTFQLKSLSMKFKEYIDRVHVFTVSQLVENCGMSGSTAKTTLKRAVAAGQVERARRGVYVSKAGRFAAAEVDSFELVSSIDPNAVVSFHSALEAHGVAHNVGSVCQFRSASIKSAFEYSGVLYVSFPLTNDLPTQSVRGRGGLRTVVTTREQTIVDCLNHPDRCGGIEEALMSISLFPYIDAEALKKVVSGKSASLAARAGWLLEQKASKWRIPSDVLDEFDEMAKGGPFKLDKDSTESHGWSRRWKLCLPEKEGEIEKWLL